MDNSNPNITLYRYFDSDGRLLYVGITGDNTKRQSQHRRNSFWFGEIASATFEHFDNRKKADDAESEAITKEKPMYNIAKRGMVLNHSPYTHMLHLAGQPDGGHDTLHKEFCIKYSELFMTANRSMPEADMVVAFAMQFARIDVDRAPNLSKCDLCKRAYESEWFKQGFKKLKGRN